MTHAPACVGWNSRSIGWNGRSPRRAGKEDKFIRFKLRNRRGWPDPPATFGRYRGAIALGENHYGLRRPRSLIELQQVAERSRAELADTVNQLRTKVSDTVTDLRERASPDALKAEAGKYVQEKADAWAKRVRNNPLQAAVIGVGAAYPLFRIARTIPTPIILVAAGLYLMGTKSGQRVASQSGQRLGEAGGKVSDQLGGSIATLNRYARRSLNGPLRRV